MIVSFASGSDSIEAALYLPDRPGPLPGVVVLPDIAGLYSVYHDAAKRLAENGFAALALNPYSRGEQPDLTSLDAIMDFIASFPSRQILADVQAAVRYLSARAEVAGQAIGLTGFCVGGQYTFLAASHCDGISAAVPWYGMLRLRDVNELNAEHPLDAVAKLHCPLLAFFGEDDGLIPKKDVDELRERAAQLALPIELQVYAGAGHAFANHERPATYNAAAAEDAWARSVTFFERHLRS